MEQLARRLVLVDVLGKMLSMNSVAKSREVKLWILMYLLLGDEQEDTEDTEISFSSICEAGV